MNLSNSNHSKEQLQQERQNAGRAQKPAAGTQDKKLGGPNRPAD